MDERAERRIREFIQEKMNGDIDNFKTFDFKTLRNSEKFGCPGRSFDCDDTEIMWRSMLFYGEISCRSYPWIHQAMRRNIAAIP